LITYGQPLEVNHYKDKYFKTFVSAAEEAYLEKNHTKASLY